jgi:hypothetical protein
LEDAVKLEECLQLFKALGAAANCTVPVETATGFSDYVGLVSAAAVVAGVVIAFFQLRSLRDGTIAQVAALVRSTAEQNEVQVQTAKIRATLDILMRIYTDFEWREQRRQFIKLRDSEDGLKRFAANLDLRKSEEALVIMTHFNVYELIALGINAGMLDEEIYKKYWRGTLLKDYAAAIEYIEIRRKDNPMLWVLFQGLAEKWKADGNSKTKRTKNAH